MSHRSLALTAALVAVVAVLLVALLASPAVGQTQSSAPKATTAGKAFTPPRTPDGKPDLQGIWSDNTLTPFERPKSLGAKEFYTDQELADLTKRTRQGETVEGAELGAANPQAVRYDLELYGFDRTRLRYTSNRTSLVVGPEGVVPPMLPQARERNTERASKDKGHEFDSYQNRPLSERCILMNQERIPMTPGANEGNLLQIVQGPGYVSLLHETDHSTRVIPTDGRAHVPQNIRLWQGDSVGHWEGNTLVVDTTNFTNLTAYRGSGEKLHLIERFTRSADDTMIYQFTVEDPTTWAKAWTAEVPWTKTKGPVYEWACHEGNTMISTILRGARVAEAEAAKKGK
ncbi:MAG TPA: hypothetical protein VE422_48325 [Terriglobia bacterium]|nr:hypothetical protein [Terriglobia bacterium]